MDRNDAFTFTKISDESCDNKCCEAIIKVGNHLISKTSLSAWIIKHVRKLFNTKKIKILKHITWKDN